MSIMLALAAVAAAQGVGTPTPPVTVHRNVIFTYPGQSNRDPGYAPVRRGGFVPSHWANPGFTIARPDAYGLRQPFGDRRWIRYYDDALLVDRGGRVHDGRYGYDWNRFRDSWSRDGRGIPIYVGNGEFYPADREYAWAERFERGTDGELAYDRDYPYDFRYGGEGVSYGCRSGCEGYTIVETTVTMPTTYEDLTSYEDVAEPVPTRRISQSRPARR